MELFHFDTALAPLGRVLVTAPAPTHNPTIS